MLNNKKRLKEFVVFAGTEDIQTNLRLISSRLRNSSKSLYSRTDLGIGCRVYSAIADSTAGQLDLLARFIKESIEITANVCRMVFEINVVFRYCKLSPIKLEDFATQAATDEISIYKSIKKLSDEDTDPETLMNINNHIEHLRNTLQKHGKKLKPDRPSTAQMAKDVGLEQEYQALYNIYSKYVHASAWLVLRKREQIDTQVYRTMMQLHTQLYAADTLYRLEDLIKKSR